MYAAFYSIVNHAIILSLWIIVLFVVFCLQQLLQITIGDEGSNFSLLLYKSEWFREIFFPAPKGLMTR